MMKTMIQKTLRHSAVIAALLATTQAWAGAYLLDNDGHPVRNERGQCWRTVEWRPDLALRECDPLYWQAAQQKKQREHKEPVVAAGAAAPAENSAGQSPAAPGATAADSVAANAPTMSPASEEVEEVTLQPLVLNTDTSFRFGDYRLTSEARDALQALSGILLARKAEELHLKITGHTDRVGTPAANMTLGLKRAEAIKAALVDMGLPAASIEVASKGATEPVTQKEDCPNDLVKCELIDCLRPDRRVVVETRAKVSVRHKYKK